MWKPQTSYHRTTTWWRFKESEQMVWRKLTSNKFKTWQNWTVTIRHLLKRVTKINKNFEVKFNNQYINETKSYKYLGEEVDHTLNLNSHLDKTYKKMTSRLRLLNKLRSSMTASEVANIYNMVIVTLFSYCSLLKPTLTQTQINRILVFER